MTRSVEIPSGVGLYPLDKDLVKEFTRHAFPEGSASEAMCDALEAARPYLAPAGDGGLREALEKLCDRYDRIAEEVSIRGGVKASYDIPGSEIRYLLAAHPAAPAVPQPAEIAEDIETTGFYYCETAGEIEAPRSGGFDVCCDKPQLHVPLTRRAWDAIRAMAADQTKAAVPQPVDREALAKVLRTELERQGVDEFYGLPGLTRSLVAAVLAGEQEQVER